jgi:hypothetical protein
VLVGHLGQREEAGGGDQGDREPDQTEGDRLPCLVAVGAADRPDQQGDEGVAGDGAGVVPVGEGGPVGVGGEADGEEEEAAVVQPDEGLGVVEGVGVSAITRAIAAAQ